MGRVLFLYTCTLNVHNLDLLIGGGWSAGLQGHLHLRQQEDRGQAGEEQNPLTAVGLFASNKKQQFSVNF